MAHENSDLESTSGILQEASIYRLSMSRSSFRRDSMRSSVSIVSDVGMGGNEVFDGPISESIPSSVVSFTHKRRCTNSSVSYTFFQEEDGSVGWSDEDAVNIENGNERLEEQEVGFRRPSIVSKRTSFSRGSVEDPLLSRQSTHSYLRDRKGGTKFSHRIYIESEDLTAVITGFSTSVPGLVIYVFLCVLTCGCACLILRWLPKWRVRLVGKPTPLRKCHWVAIEDQWSQLTVHDVSDEEYGRPLSSIFTEDHTPILHADEESDPVIASLRYVEYRYLRFFYNHFEDRFSLISGWKDPSWTNAKTMRSGLDSEDRDGREQIFGQNIIDIKAKSITQLLVDESFHPFYVFQVASLTLWSLDEYYYYAACIFLISVISIAATIVETRSNIRRLREISLFECFVRVLRNGFWRSVLSPELVPGDVFEISDPSLNQVPCDCILLSGDCILNESMLTGESVPVSKSPLTDEALKYLDLSAPSVHPVVAKHFLFSGTKIIRARRPHDGDDEAVALAIVVRTGFLTTKGALVRSMLFPKPSGFKFYQDSFRYISVMGVIATLGFFVSLVNFIHLGLAWHVIIVRALDLITIVVPPALPATLTIGTNFAIARLRRETIFCISPQRVNVGGKLDVVCFDKTGTLTEEGLDVLGVRIVERSMKFSELLTSASLPLAQSPTSNDTAFDTDKYKRIIYTMSTCHSLRVVDGELLGDPLDVKMFQFTGWSYEEGGNRSSAQPNSKYDTIIPSIARPPVSEIADDSQISNGTSKTLELGLLRSFEFVSELRRASVVVRQFGDSGVHVFVKGAPESIKSICRPESLPDDFEDLLIQYTHRGFRVIACATKYKQKLSWMKVQKMTRAEAESDLEFVGFIIFENKLKPSTTGVIGELNQAGIRNIMCTGDNILTAVSVARECGLIPDGELCFVPHFAEELDAKPTLTWECLDDPELRLDENTLMPLQPAAGIDLSVPATNLNMGKYSVAVSGDVFRWILDYGTEEVINRMLVCGRVFARMSPDEKHELVEKLQSIDYCCGFCGDGANDCGALKAADVGISLSDAEASVAAPFTSQIFEISCVPTVIKEGQAALVTSFCCFKYMSLYSAIQFTSVSFLYKSASNLGDFQFLFIDLALILPIAIFMGWTGPYPVLSTKRPTADLVSRKVLTPLLGQVTLCILTQYAAYKTVRLQQWFNPPKVDLDHTNIENSENTVLFLTSCYQYIFTSIVLSVGPPFREPMISNKPFLCTILVDLLIAAYMLFIPSKWVTKVMQLTYLSTTFEAWIFGLAMGSFLISWIGEKRLFPMLAKVLGVLYRRLRRNYRKKSRQYKTIMAEMRKP